MKQTYVRDFEFEDAVDAIPNVERVEEKNYKSFCLNFINDDDKDSFASSASYYLFTGRRGLWVYRHHTGAVVPFCWHPNVSGQILVFPSRYKQGDFGAVRTLLSLLPAPENGIRLARFKKDDLRSLNAIRFLDQAASFSEVEETELDWRYPLHVLSTERTMKAEGSGYMLIRNRVRQAYKKQLSVAAFSSSYVEDIKDLAYRWALLRSDDKETVLNLITPYFSLLDLLQQEPLGLKGLVFFVDGQVEAISAWDVSNTDMRVANLYMNLCNTSFKGLSEFMIQETSRFLFEKEGVEYLNLGGSETEALNRYKSKFVPAYSQELITMQENEAVIAPFTEIETQVEVRVA